MKKLISVMLVILLLVSLVPAVFAAETSGQISKDISWSYDEKTKTLTVSGTGEIPWLRANEPWKDFREEVETLIIGEGITQIGAENFNGLTRLKKLTLPSTLRVIGMEAFAGCSSLQDFTLPASVGRIDQQAFYCCSSLTKMILPDQIRILHTGAFWNCSSLSELHLPANLQTLGNLCFSGCHSLTEVDIPNGVTEIPKEAFLFCKNLKTIHLPRNLQSIGENAFEGCGMEEIWIPATVKKIYHTGYDDDGAFYKCPNLKAIYFLGDAPITSERCFYDCAETLTLYHTADSKGWDNPKLVGTDFFTKKTVELKTFTYTHTAPKDCTGSGAEMWSCPETGVSVTRSTVGLSHEWSYMQNAAHMDGKDGSWVRTCAVCGKTETVAIPDQRVEAVPAVSSNRDKQTYNTYGSTAKSYLVAQENGGLLRIEALKDSVTAEFYDSADNLISRMKLPMELPIFGGFYAGQDYNFLVFGQNNPDESDDVEVIRVVRYSKDMLRCGEVSIYGANTVVPFSSGFVRMEEAEGTLFIHTCHTMYKNSDGYPDGLNHQANMVFSIDIDRLRVNECFSRISGTHYGYFSHSFNQFLVIDNDMIYTVNQCDSGFERGADISCYPAAASCGRFHDLTEYVYMCYHNAFPFAKQASSTSYNVTGASLGGLAVSDKCLVLAGSSSRAAEVRAKDQQNTFLTFTQKGVFDAPKENIGRFGAITGDYTKTVWLTDFAENSGVKVSTPQLVRINGNKLLVLWTENETLRWTFFDGEGKQLTKTFSVEGSLSDCVPVLQNGIIVWYVTENSTPVFCRLDLAKPETITVSALVPTEPDEPAPIEPTGSDEPTPVEPTGSDPFVDVKKGSYYYDAVLWAVGTEPQITAGTGAGKFSPDMICTRAQIVTFLWRAAGCPTISPYDNSFADVPEDVYYYDAVNWAELSGITSGTGENLFSPDAPCSRAQAITLLWRAAGCPTISPYDNSFADVLEDVYYYDAVNWAELSGITSGTGADTFSPNMICTRAQIVTLLYKAFVF